jgi:hypothetical protein
VLNPYHSAVSATPALCVHQIGYIEIARLYHTSFRWYPNRPIPRLDQRRDLGLDLVGRCDIEDIGLGIVARTGIAAINGIARAVAVNATRRIDFMRFASCPIAQLRLMRNLRRCPPWSCDPGELNHYDTPSRRFIPRHTMRLACRPRRATERHWAFRVRILIAIANLARLSGLCSLYDVIR